MQGKIFHQASWAKTHLGTDIQLYKKSHSRRGFSAGSASDSSEAPILFIGGVHGDEPEGVRLAEEFLNWLLSQEENQDKSTPDPIRPWLLIPCLNPDGYNRHERTNSRGVDLNRNFPSQDWSTEAKAPRYSPGPSPGSELETQALVALIDSEKPQLIVHFHSWEPCVVYTGAPGKEAAETLATGTTYECREDIGYPTPGSLGQYGWLDKKIPVICIEEQEHCDLNTIWPRFQTGLKLLITYTKESR